MEPQGSTRSRRSVLAEDAAKAESNSPSGNGEPYDPVTFHKGKVADVLWTLTERCNLHCSYCDVIPHGDRLAYDPAPGEVDRILDQLASLPGLQSVAHSADVEHADR